MATTNRVGLPRYIPPIVQQLNPAMDRNHEDSLFGMANGQHHEDCLFNKKYAVWWGLPTPLKNDGLKVSMSVMMKFPAVSGKSFKIPWFQTTNQVTLQKTRKKNVQFMNIHRVLANVRKTNGFPYLC